MLKPSVLQPGHTIGIIAPGSPILVEQLAAGVRELERLGFRTRYREDILAAERYLAGSLERRLTEFYELWEDPRIDAIIAARGGYGCQHLLPFLDATRIRKHPKILVGYSDLTALQLFLLQNCELVTFHGPMVTKDFAEGPAHYDWDSFERVLCYPNSERAFSSPGTSTLIGGTATGRLVGGCLSLITALIGTPWQLETRNSILFLEDVAERPFRLDRMLHQMKLAGMFDQVRGILFGEMYDCTLPSEAGYQLEDLCFDLIKDIGVPALFGWQSGHSPIKNRTLPLGIQVKLDADRQEVELLEAAVSATK
ncbi:MAG: LD-carboxypeptidase [Acidobacteria bacterium]|nr:LD-carboxypeptidase [Acidobacteriota bacterium]